MPDYLIAIDGGGTSCRAAVATAEGTVLATAKSGAANILTDLDGALDNIIKAARLAFTNAGLDPSTISEARALLGLAGSNVGDVATRLLARLPFRQSQIESDGLIALEGAFGDADGAVAILGTGSIYISRHTGAVRYYGGWGFIVGDLGSGAWLGHGLLRECLLASDGIHQGTALTTEILRDFNDDPSQLVAFARYAAPSDFGRYAPRVFDAASHGDPIAMRLIRLGATAINETLDVVVANGFPRICLLGGLAPFYPRWLSEAHQARLVQPAHDALSGAVSMAVSRFSARVQA